MRVEKHALDLPEIIGSQVKVKNSTCKDYIGITGTVLDETENTLVVQVGKRKMRLPKNNCTFEFNGIQLEGRTLLGKPEDRLKK